MQEKQQGIDVILDTVGFDLMYDKAELVLTGEGRIDAQSLRGRGKVRVAWLQGRKNMVFLLMIAVVHGDIGDGIDKSSTI